MRFFLSLCLLFAPALAHADALHVQGNKLFYGPREIVLQGVAVGDPLLARQGRPLSDYDFIAHDWNANAVRISIHPGTWKKYGRKAVLAALHENINAAFAAGMFPIITWHAIGVPDGYTQAAPPPYAADLYDSDFHLAREFWQAVAKEFGQDGRILFELWNEPVWPTANEGKWPMLKPRWQQLTSIIRKRSNNVIIASGSGWGYNLQGITASSLPDANTAYAWHVYASTDGNDPAAWEKNLAGLAEKKPVIVTEWGFEPEEKNSGYYGTANSYGYLFYDRFLKEKNLSFTAWCWHPTWMPRMLKDDWRTPTEYGNFIKEILWRRPGSELIRP